MVAGAVAVGIEKLGARVRIKGVVRTFDGAPEIHVREAEVERTAPPDDPRAALAGYFLECVEAEAAGALRLRIESRNHLEVGEGTSPFHLDRESDSARDAAVEAEGWKVMHFSGRQLSRDVERCVEAISAAAVARRF